MMNAFAHKIIPTGSWLFWVFCFCFAYNLTTSTLMLIELRLTKPYKLSHKLYKMLSIVELITTFNIPFTLLVSTLNLEFESKELCKRIGYMWNAIITGLFALSNGILLTISIARYISIEYPFDIGSMEKKASRIGLVCSFILFGIIAFLSIHKYTSFFFLIADALAMFALYIVVNLPIIILNMYLFVYLHTKSRKSTSSGLEKAVITLVLIAFSNFILSIPLFTSFALAVVRFVRENQSNKTVLLESFFENSGPFMLGMMFNGGINSTIYICKSRKWINKLFKKESRNRTYTQTSTISRLSSTK